MSNTRFYCEGKLTRGVLELVKDMGVELKEIDEDNEKFVLEMPNYVDQDVLDDKLNGMHITVDSVEDI